MERPAEHWIKAGPSLSHIPSPWAPGQRMPRRKGLDSELGQCCCKKNALKAALLVATGHNKWEESMMKWAALMALAFFATTPAAAGEFKTCSELGVGIETVLWSAMLSGIEVSIMENGSILVDLKEPVATSFGVAVVIPSHEIGSLRFATLGYTDVDLATAKATYDSAKGLVVTLPTKVYSANSKDGNKPGDPLVVTVNLNDNTVTTP